MFRYFWVPLYLSPIKHIVYSSLTSEKKWLLPNNNFRQMEQLKNKNKNKIEASYCLDLFNVKSKR